MITFLFCVYLKKRETAKSAKCPQTPLDSKHHHCLPLYLHLLSSLQEPETPPILPQGDFSARDEGLSCQRRGPKGYNVTVQGSGAAGKWDGPHHHWTSWSYESSHIPPVPLPVYHDTDLGELEGEVLPFSWQRA